MAISHELKYFLSETPLPWAKPVQRSTGEWIVEFFVDNHLLSTYRACPQHFFYLHVEGWRMKPSYGGKSWFLEFGIYLHEMLESFYLNFQSPGFDPLRWSTGEARELWEKKGMDQFSEHKEYKGFGGFQGVSVLLYMYGLFHMKEASTLKIIGTEVAFGKGKEVPLTQGIYDFDAFLSGRVDLLVDDSYMIYPIDHKTKATFGTDLGKDYINDDGPTGYVYALNKVLPSLIPEEETLKRGCSQIAMNLICKKSVPVEERFRRIILRKSEQQLKLYERRQITTLQHLLLDLENYAFFRDPARNTDRCQNWMRGECNYSDVCRQSDKAAIEGTLNNKFTRMPLWDTETVTGSALQPKEG